MGSPDYVMVEPELDLSYEGPEIRKIIVNRGSPGVIKILKSDGSTQVNGYNFANYLYPYRFTTSEQTRLEHPLGSTSIRHRGSGRYFLDIEGLFGEDATLPSRRRYELYHYQWRPGPYSRTKWSHPDEENTDVEIADKFFWIPPIETTTHRIARFQDELTHVARRGIEKLLTLNDIPLLLTQYDNYSGTAPGSSYRNFLRNGITGFKACIGYLQSQLSSDTISQTVEDAIYGLYEYFHTVETRDESGVGIDFYNMCFSLTAAADWDGAYSGKVVRIPNADGTAGAILRDVVAENTVTGDYDAVAGSAEYRGYATGHFQTAYFHLDRNHGQIEELHIEEYMPLGRNTNLSSLRLWISDTPSGAELTFMEDFDPDVLTYIGSTDFGGLNSIYIQATAENPDAVITGAGLIATTVGVNVFEIVVTSQDTHATKTYTITAIRLG